MSANAAAPPRAGVVLFSLITVAAVANLNLSVANVALPSIGRAFDSSQTTLDLIAVGYSLGLAASYPQYSSQIIAAANSSFLAGADWAYTAGISAILVGAVIVFFLFPRGRTRSASSRSTTPRTRREPAPERVQRGGATQRNPRWLMPVSTMCGRRAAGRYRRQ